MRRRAGIFVVMAVMACVVFISFLNAQEEIPEYTYGAVVSVSSRSITILEYDYDKEEEVERVYGVTQDTIFEHDASLSNMAPGDMADIEYMLSGNSRVARSVMIEKALAEVSESGEIEGGAEEEPVEAGGQPGKEGGRPDRGGQQRDEGLEMPVAGEDPADLDEMRMGPEMEMGPPGSGPGRRDHPILPPGTAVPYSEGLDGEFRDELN